MVRLAQASIDENGIARGGKAGNQSGRELNIVNWYSHPWHTVLRPRDTKIAAKIASNAITGVHNKHIGYDQSQRTTLYDEASKVKFDLTKVKKDCETDCSAFVSVVCNASGVKVSKDMYTGNEVAVLNSTGKFEVLTDRKYIVNDTYLRTGDILVGNGHTAIVCGSTTTNATKAAKAVPVNNQKVQAALLVNKSYAGKYYAQYTIFLRSSANKKDNTNVITSIPKNKTINCYGYYNITESKIWLLVIYDDGKNKYTGYVSKDVVHKKG